MGAYGRIRCFGLISDTDDEEYQFLFFRQKIYIFVDFHIDILRNIDGAIPDIYTLQVFRDIWFDCQFYRCYNWDFDLFGVIKKDEWIDTKDGPIITI